MQTWAEIYEDICQAVKSLNVGTTWFRGHGSETWKLLPSLARSKQFDTVLYRYRSEGAREQGVYHRFMHEAGTLLTSSDSWQIAFAMQHHGIPTRLLDWTTTFAVALYFAIRDATSDAVIWILNPYALNEQLSNRNFIFELSDLPGDYNNMLIHPAITGLPPAVAFDLPRTHPRVFNQRGGFTLHSELQRPLEDIVGPSILKKIVVPQSIHD